MKLHAQMGLRCGRGGDLRLPSPCSSPPSEDLASEGDEGGGFNLREEHSMRASCPRDTAAQAKRGTEPPGELCAGIAALHPGPNPGPAAVGSRSTSGCTPGPNPVPSGCTRGAWVLAHAWCAGQRLGSRGAPSPQHRADQGGAISRAHTPKKKKYKKRSLCSHHSHAGITGALHEALRSPAPLHATLR